MFQSSPWLCGRQLPPGVVTPPPYAHGSTPSACLSATDHLPSGFHEMHYCFCKQNTSQAGEGEKVKQFNWICDVTKSHLGHNS